MLDAPGLHPYISALVKLGSRLLLAVGGLSLLLTLLLSLTLREAWKRAEERRFVSEFEAAVRELGAELDRVPLELARRLVPLCQHDPQIDSILIGLSSDSVAPRLLPLRITLEDQRKLLGLHELALTTDHGELLAGSWLGGSRVPAAVSDSRAKLRDRVERHRTNPGLRAEPPLSFEASCIASRHGRWVALVAATPVESLLAGLGERRGLELLLSEDDPSLGKTPPAAPVKEHGEYLEREVLLDALGGRTLSARRSREPLGSVIESVNVEIASAALVTLLGAVAVSLFLARRLSEPVRSFAERTRQAMSGVVSPLPVEGGPELEDAARAFNRTLGDLAELRARLRVTERIAARREVARRIAHEIKNPLTPIRTSVETLRRLKAREAPEFDSYFDDATRTVLGEVARIDTLVRTFAEYGRLPSPEPAEFDLGDLCRDLTTLHADLGAQVRLEGANASAGSAAERTVLFADRSQVTQVLTNLLKNGIEATSAIPNAEVVVRVGRSDGGEGDARIWVEVSDNGPGVPSELVATLFEPYVTTKTSGTGLGLPISERIAVEHGGSLTYQSRPGGGATFRLDLPAKGPPPRLDDPGHAPGAEAPTA